MSMFEFPNDYLEKMSASNPFEAMMPDADVMNTLMRDWMDMVPVAGQMADAMDFGFPKEAMPGNPVEAAVGGSAIMLGMASQMLGFMAGSVTSALEQADKMKGGKGEVDLSAFTAAMPNPFTFDWAFAAAETASPSARAKPAAKTTAKTVREMTKKAVRTAEDLAAESADIAVDAKEAVAETLNPAVGAVLKPEVVGKVAERIPAAKKKAPTAKKSAAVKAKSPAKAKAVNDDKAPEVAKAAPAAAKVVAETVMPEDFIKPKMMAKPENPDDLKLISGVGPKLEQVLNSLGIWSFGQIAAWTPNEIAWVDDYLQFKGRIERDDWLGQARKLAKT